MVPIWWRVPPCTATQWHSGPAQRPSASGRLRAGCFCAVAFRSRARTDPLSWLTIGRSGHDVRARRAIAWSDETSRSRVRLRHAVPMPSLPASVATAAEYLVGREREKSVLDQMLADARRGTGGALVVHGEPGVGKTALLAY